jgi:hypothetical protein
VAKFGDIPTTDDMVASAISFTPTGTVAATDVQAAIAEVASEVGMASGPMGLIASQTLTANSSVYSVTGNTDFTLVNVSLTAGRTYKIYLHSAMSSAGTGDWQLFALTGEAVNTYIGRYGNPLAGGLTVQVDASVLFVPQTTRIQTIQIQATRVSGSTIQFLAGATQPRQLWIEDPGA